MQEGILSLMQMPATTVAIEELKERARKMSVDGHRQYNPGWHLALDLPHMLLVGECIARAALQRQESRGGHTRDDYPQMSADWRRRLLVCALDGSGGVRVEQEPITPIRPDLLALFERSELAKYLTEDELTPLDEQQEAGHGS